MASANMTFAEAIPLGALIVSLSTLVYTSISIRRKANGEELDKLEGRLDTVERKLAECEQHRAQLITENVDLMRRVTRMKK